MKGTPQLVMCACSDRALRALRAAGAPVTTVDVLPDPQIRQALSALSGWPTIPQVFIKGELVGGADIVELPRAASCRRSSTRLLAPTASRPSAPPSSRGPLPDQSRRSPGLTRGPIRSRRARPIRTRRPRKTPQRRLNAPHTGL